MRTTRNINDLSVPELVAERESVLNHLKNKFNDMNEVHRFVIRALDNASGSAEGVSAEEQEKRLKSIENFKSKFALINNNNASLVSDLRKVSVPTVEDLAGTLGQGRLLTQEIDSKIEAGIKRLKADLKFKLIVAEKLGRPFLEINDQDIKEYQKICDQELLIEWLPKELTEKGKSQKKQGAKKTKGRRPAPQAKTMSGNEGTVAKNTPLKPAKQKPKTSEGAKKTKGHRAPAQAKAKSVKGATVAKNTPLRPVKEEPIAPEAARVQVAPEVVNVQVTPEVARARFLSDLLIANPHCRLKEMDRVTRRWKDATNADIRNFSERYQLLTDEEINKQRARHLLPGLDSLLRNDQFKRIYTFTTSKGIALLSTLHYGPSAEKGIVYVGITDEKGHGKIYHKYFEPHTRKSLKGNVTIDPNQEALPVQEENEWTHTLPFDPEIAADGTLTLRFPNELHYIQIEPVRTDLLDATIFTKADD